jgi:primosomal protein N' (replication factor Y)
VELAVVQDADATLRFPDFRADERTFALVSQLAGRSGRGPGGGRVLVQTMSPGIACLQYAAHHDAAGFLAAEMERRRTLRYPPFATLIHVTASAPAQEVSDRTAGRIAERLAGLEVLGPAPLFRLKDLHRTRLVVKAAERDAAVRTVGAAVREVGSDRKLKHVKLVVDVDPQ